MRNVVSRLAVAAVAIPIVLGAVYFGGWWLAALVLVAAVLGLHEYWLMTKPLALLAPAGYIGAVLAIVGAKLGGIRADDRRRPDLARPRVRAEGHLSGATVGHQRDLGDGPRAVRPGSAAASPSLCSSATCPTMAASRR